MKVLVVGNGGREHAIIQSLKKSKKIDEIIAIAGNGGIAADATTVDINVSSGAVCINVTAADLAVTSSIVSMTAGNSTVIQLELTAPDIEVTAIQVSLAVLDLGSLADQITVFPV